MKTIASVDYYLTLSSPWSYLGHERFVAIAAKYGATIHLKPVDYGKIFPASGGVPLAQRPEQRKAYRLTELKRWQEYLGVPLNLHPKFFPVSPEAAARYAIAATDVSLDAGLAFCGATMRACWAEDRDISNVATLQDIADACGLDAAALRARADMPETGARYAALTDEALRRQVFGAPTYAYNNELFWGQDRLEFVERALAKA